MDLWVQVRRYVLAEGHSKREACRRFGLNWRKMQKMLEHADPPGYRRVAAPRTRKIDRVMPFLEAMLEADRTAPHKQRHTSKRIYERLVEVTKTAPPESLVWSHPKGPADERQALHHRAEDPDRT